MTRSPKPLDIVDINTNVTNRSDNMDKWLIRRDGGKSPNATHDHPVAEWIAYPGDLPMRNPDNSLNFSMGIQAMRLWDAEQNETNREILRKIRVLRLRCGSIPYLSCRYAKSVAISKDQVINQDNAWFSGTMPVGAYPPVSAPPALDEHGYFSRSGFFHRYIIPTVPKKGMVTAQTMGYYRGGAKLEAKTYGHGILPFKWVHDGTDGYISWSSVGPHGPGTRGTFKDFVPPKPGFLIGTGSVPWGGYYPVGEYGYYTLDTGWAGSWYLTIINGNYERDAEGYLVYRQSVGPWTTRLGGFNDGVGVLAMFPKGPHPPSSPGVHRYIDNKISINAGPGDWQSLNDHGAYELPAFHSGIEMTTYRQPYEYADPVRPGFTSYHHGVDYTVGYLDEEMLRVPGPPKAYNSAPSSTGFSGWPSYSGSGYLGMPDFVEISYDSVLANYEAAVTDLGLGSWIAQHIGSADDTYEHDWIPADYSASNIGSRVEARRVGQQVHLRGPWRWSNHVWKDHPELATRGFSSETGADTEGGLTSTHQAGGSSNTFGAQALYTQGYESQVHGFEATGLSVSFPHTSSYGDVPAGSADGVSFPALITEGDPTDDRAREDLFGY